MTNADRGLVRLTNGIVELEVSIRFGPRVLRYGLVGAANMFAEAPDGPIPTTLGEWLPWGGHRLWVAPESMPGSYAPDSQPVAHEQHDDRSAAFRQRVDGAGIEKQMTVALGASGTGVTITHTIINRTHWPIRVAPWAITAVSPESTAVIPQPPHRSHAEDLLPARALVQWSFTDFTDARWSIGRRLIRLTPDKNRLEPQKAGVGNAEGWCAVVAADHRVFVKRFAWDPRADYPDFGCNNEVYTAGAYLEVETLGPLRVLGVGEPADHVEEWYLFPDTAISGSDQSDDRQFDELMALVGSTRPSYFS
jgi:hypothetical protein